MPGSWELKQNNSVLVAILHTDVTTIAWAFGLKNLVIPGQVTALAGMPFDHARNVACRQALERGVEWLFFLDSDVIPPHDAILRLIAHRKPVISGLYCRRSPPQGVPVAMKNGTWLTQFQMGAVVEVDYVGAGCLLIHRDVLQALPPSRPEAAKMWFDWKVDMAGLVPVGEALSEDFAFCLECKRKLGIQVLLDTSVRCRHVGYAQSDYTSFVPCDAATIT